MELELTQEDRARINDTSHKIQSANEVLAKVDSRKIPGVADILECLRNSDKTLRAALRSMRAAARPKKLS